jgi:hypothetical protein
LLTIKAKRWLKISGNKDLIGKLESKVTSPGLSKNKVTNIFSIKEVKNAKTM